MMDEEKKQQIEQAARDAYEEVFGDLIPKLKAEDQPLVQESMRKFTFYQVMQRTDPERAGDHEVSANSALNIPMSRFGLRGEQAAKRMQRFSWVFAVKLVELI